MDASLSRSSIPERKDPHEWNTWDHYRTIHERRIAEHHFIDSSKPNTLEFELIEDEGILLLSGRIFCLENVILEVEKLLEVRRFGNALRVRGFSYRYAAWVDGGYPVLRYHNIHLNDDDYHHRAFNPQTGEQVFYERLERYQFPVLTEVIDEIEVLMKSFDA